MSNVGARIIPCPTCKKATRWNASNTFRPFCSERCRLIDLGAWADNKHVIEGDSDFSGISRELESDEPS